MSIHLQLPFPHIVSFSFSINPLRRDLTSLIPCILYYLTRGIPREALTRYRRELELAQVMQRSQPYEAPETFGRWMEASTAFKGTPSLDQSLQTKTWSHKKDD